MFKAINAQPVDTVVVGGGQAGLYFLGMPWVHSRRSGILFGVGDDAAHIAQHIAARNMRAGVLTEVWQDLGAQE